MKYDMYADALLTVGLIAFALIVVAGICVIVVMRIGRHALPVIQKEDPELYRNIVGDRSVSWIERGYDSIKDIGLWWRLYKSLGHNGNVSSIVGKQVSLRFSRYYRLLLISWIAAIVMGGSVVIVGFVLATNQ